MADADARADTAVADLEALKETLVRRIRQLLMQLPTKGGVLVGDDLVSAARVRAQVLNALRKQGSVPMVDAFEAQVIGLVNDLVRDMPSPEPGFGAQAGPELQAIVDGITGEIAEQMDQVSDDVRRAINHGITTGGSLDELVVHVGDSIGARVARAQAAVDTGIIATNRATTILQTEHAAAASGEEFVYRYVGPKDRKTRQYCGKLLALNYAYTRGALAALRNDDPHQPEPVSTFGGGYRCRHQWVPMPRTDAEADGLHIEE